MWAKEQTPVAQPSANVGVVLLKLYTAGATLTPILDDPLGLPVYTNGEEMIKQHRILN